MFKKFFIFFLILLIAGCAQQKSEKIAQVIRFNNGTEPETIDPARSTGIPEANIEIQCFEGLTRLDKNSSPSPGIAKSWEVSKDGLKYIFHLRDARWSNGDKLTAYDFEYSWKRALSPELAAEYAYQLYYIKNAEKYNKGKIKDKNLVGVKAIDEKTLLVELEYPTPYFLSLTSFPTYFPVNRKIVEKNPRWATRPETYIGCGPFKLVKWEHNHKMEFEKNENYWDAQNVKLEKLIFYLVEEASTELTMYETGKLDYADNPPVQDIERLKKEKILKTAPLLGTYYYKLNITKPPLNNRKVRRALALAIDRKAIVEKITKGGQVPALAFVPPGIIQAGKDFRSEKRGYFKDNDVETAKKLLEEAGYKNGKNFPKLTILYNTSESHKMIAEAIQEMWRKNLGIEVNLKNQEWKVYLNTLQKLDYQIARAGWVGDYIDPMTFLDMWVTGGGNNQTGWGNREYDSLIKQAKKTKDLKKRLEIMHKCENILMEEMPVIPIYFYTDLFLCRDYVKNVIKSPLGFVDFKYAYVEK